MAKKKKLNKELAAVLLVGAIVVVGGGGFVLQYYIRGNYRPQKFKKEGYELLQKGDYAEAQKRFQKAGPHMATDMELLTWLYDSLMHQTSFKDQGMRDASMLLERMLATNASHTPTLIERLKFILTIIDEQIQYLGILRNEAIAADEIDRIKSQAERVLAKEPENVYALRAMGLVKVAKALRSNSVMSSTDIEAALGELRAHMEANPEIQELLMYYACTTVRLRDTMVREAQINKDAKDPKVVAMLDDVNGRIEAMIKSGEDETRPAPWRANAFLAAAHADAWMLTSGMVGDNDRARTLMDRRMKSLESASNVMPASEEDYVAARMEYADSLQFVFKTLEAETVLRDTMKAAPLQWTPRLALADLASELNRPGESVELLSAELKPDYQLVGLLGSQFVQQSKIVPLRRAFFRLQNLDKIKPEDRDAELARVQADYDAAVAEGRNPDADPYALQVKAGLLELRSDRTGAVQLLTRALQNTDANDVKLRSRVMRQLVTLNLGLNQPGAAISMLEQIVAAEARRPTPLWFQSAMQLVDLRIKQGNNDQARTLLDQLDKIMPNNPALAVLRVRLASNPVDRSTGLASLKEETKAEKVFKFRFARELGDDATIRRLATDVLKDDPGATEVAVIYADYLRRNNDRDAAMAVLKAAQEKNADDKAINLLIRDMEATTAEDREKLVGELAGSPYRKKLIEADQARMMNDAVAYKARLEEAEALDGEGGARKEGKATEQLFYFHVANGDAAGAEAALERLSKLDRDPSVLRVMRIRLALGKDKVDEAGAMADALVAERPSFAPGWIAKGQSHQARGQYDQALAAYETAVVSMPDNLEALRGLVESADRAGRPDVLKKYIDQGLRVTKNDDYFTDWSLRYQVAFGDPIPTIDVRLKRRDAHPDRPETWLALAQSYLSSAEYKAKAGDVGAAKEYRDKSIALFREAMVKFPDAPGFVLEAANQMFRGGDVEGSFKLVTDMLANPKFAENPGIRGAIVDFYIDHGRGDLALDLLQKTIDEGKATDALKLKLAQVRTAFGEAKRAQDPEGAKAEMDAALAAIADMKDSAIVREMRMNIYLAANRLPEALQVVNDALAVTRTGPNLLMAATVNAKQGNIAEALKLANEAVALNPDEPIARFTRARIMLGERPIRNNDLIADLEVVRKSAPGNVESRLILVDRLQSIGRNSEAMQELETINREYPGNLEGAMRIIQTYALEKRYTQIDIVLNNAKKAGLDRSVQLLSLEAGVYSTRNASGDMPRAIEAMRTAVKLAPNDIGLYRNFMGLLIKAGANKEVIDELDRIEKQNGALYWTYMTRGVALHRLKQDAEGVKQFDRAMEMAQQLKESAGPVNEVANNFAMEYGAEVAVNWAQSKLPKTIDTRLLVMRLLVAGGKMDKALAVGEELLPDLEQLPVPIRLQVLQMIGSTHLTNVPQRADKAVVMFKQIVELDPNNVMALNNLAYAMTLPDSGASPKEAVEYARRANDLMKKNAAPNAVVMDTYGWSLILAGQVDEGLVVLQEALNEERLPEVEYHIGEAWVRKNDKSTALQSLQNALATLTRAEQNGQSSEKSLRKRIEDRIVEVEAMPDLPKAP